jgi:hypothetical protein
MTRYTPGVPTEPVDTIDVHGFSAYNVFSDLFLGESLDLFGSNRHISWVDSFPDFARATAIVA